MITNGYQRLGPAATGAAELQATWLRLRWPLTAALATALVAGVLLRFTDSTSSEVQLTPSDLPQRETHAGFLPDGRVDLNTASLELLMTLPGIGEATAAEIIRVRAQRPFSSLVEVDECCAFSAFDPRELEALAGVQ